MTGDGANLSHAGVAWLSETADLEILTARLRAGNPGSNTAADHVTVLADALDQFPVK